jgi:hypothetical protein
VTFTVSIATLCAALGAGAGEPSLAAPSAVSLAGGSEAPLLAERKLADVVGGQRPAPAKEMSSSCVGEICAPRVTIPGREPPLIRPSRVDLAATYLARMDMNFLSKVARGLLTTGLRVEYTPPAFTGASSAPTAWGTVFVRVRFRVDATNVPVVWR